MLVKNKNALVFAAAGAIASEVARQLERQGAAVFLSGRTDLFGDTLR